jgi:hypothetical protein
MILSLASHVPKPLPDHAYHDRAALSALGRSIAKLAPTARGG